MSACSELLCCAETPDALNESERRELEKIGLRARNGDTNYFQLADTGLTPPRNPMVTKSGNIKLTWDTSYAGNEPINQYEIIGDGQTIGTVTHKPQVSKEPFSFEASKGKQFKIVAVNAAGRKSETALLTV
jgi:hypothetical protein